MSMIRFFFSFLLLVWATPLLAFASDLDDWPGEKSEQGEFVRFDFSIDGRACYVVLPEETAPGRPWVWRARFPKFHVEVDQILLRSGFHVAYMNTDGMFGSDKAMEHWDAFYRNMTEAHGLARRAVLEGVSRGGLFIYHWAARHPERVACIYADSPVLDFKSWPMRHGEGDAWKNLLEEYGFTEEQAITYTGNPIDNLAPIAEANIPLYHIVCTKDIVVPPTENTQILQQRYKKLGGEITVETVAEGSEGSGHHHFDPPNPQLAADFILKNSFDRLPRESDYFLLRGGLENSRIKFEREKKGRVVFMGGSITNMVGWRQMVGRDLQRRFPDTEFDFINSGIPSTGSVPGAFRTLRDVFGAGPVDILFEEAAVNDAASPPEHWRRGMEGILRHARSVDPTLDIVVMHFVDPGKVEYYNNDTTPPVIVAHDKAAAYYDTASIYLAEEVAHRMGAGQFSWEKDFRNLHPAKYGHRLYTATIGRMFDAAWGEPLASGAKVQPHAMPKEPLDPYSYFRGRLANINEAVLGDGWKLDPKWRPRTENEKAGTRPGFVDVPMLTATEPGAELRLAFKGTAVGLWTVAGPDAGIIEFNIDGGEWRKRDLLTVHSSRLHLPRVEILADTLKDGPHTLTVRTTDKKNAGSRGHACRIVNFAVNGE